MRSRTSVSESRLGEWQTFQKMGAAGAPALRAHHGWARSEENIARSTAFSNRKMASPRRHPYRLSAHSGVRKPDDLLPSLLRTLSEWRLKRSAGLG